ncbi:MAG: ABC transporter permease [Verrucomicrobiota bacterium]|nr:ABC transporter permease [Verrucomicrobiota bacterium]
MRIYEPEFFEESNNFFINTGRKNLLIFRNAGRGLLISLESLLLSFRFLHRRKEIGKQLYTTGIKSFAVTSVVALFTGMILSLQAGIILRDVGQEVNVGTLVAQTMCREMGPFMTALILAASVGAAIAAEIGTMTVAEEIDALHTMSINPADYLVMPRMIAMLIMAPVLTIYTNVVGILGGMLIAKTQLGVAPIAYYNNAMMTLANKEIYVGLLKSIVFGFIIVTVCCYRGFATTNGAVGVGKATRTSVVHNFLLILIIGYFITRIFY